MNLGKIISTIFNNWIIMNAIQTSFGGMAV